MRTASAPQTECDVYSALTNSSTSPNETNPHAIATAHPTHLATRVDRVPCRSPWGVGIICLMALSVRKNKLCGVTASVGNCRTRRAWGMAKCSKKKADGVPEFIGTLTSVGANSRGMAVGPQLHWDSRKHMCPTSLATKPGPAKFADHPRPRHQHFGN